VNAIIAALVGQGLEIAIGVERGVRVLEARVVAEATHALAPDPEELHRVALGEVDRSAEVHAPAEVALVTGDAVAHRERAHERAELEMSERARFPAHVEPAIGRVLALARGRIRGGVDLDVRILDADREVPLVGELARVVEHGAPGEDHRVRALVVDVSGHESGSSQTLYVKPPTTPWNWPYRCCSR
jgi:hypothetical protein